MEFSPTTQAAGLSVSNITASYRGTVAVNGISFEIPPSEFVTLLGPSGCGKSTTLRSVAGLHKIDSGQISIGGITVADAHTHIRPEHRQINMVFQSYAIWPHMTVAENVAYGLKLMGKPRHVVRKQVGDMLDLVGLHDFADRPATGLSGGQQQRVALARALATQPRILLLDEPLSNLDSVLRVRMRSEILRIQKETGTTTLYVTHDCAEALSMSDRIVVMEKGVIAQSDKPENLYRFPTSRFVAEFLGHANVINGRIVATDDENVTIDARGIGASKPLIVRRRPGDDPKVGSDVQIVIRPENLHTTNDPDEQKIIGTILQREYLGNRTEVTVQVNSEVMKMDAVSNLHAAVGDTIDMGIRPQEMTWIEVKK